MKRSAAALALTLLIILSLFVGCGTSATENSVSDKYSPEYGEMSSDKAETGGGSSLEIGVTDPQRKLVYTVSYSIQTTEFGFSLPKLQSLCAELGGYVESSSVEGTTRRFAQLVLRIPADSLNTFFSRVGEVGSVTSESMSTQDVTLEYVDYTARLDSLKTRETRILALLDGATDLQYVLDIETELADIRYEIESVTSKLNKLSSLVSYSTVNVNLSEVYTLSDVKAEPQTFGEKLGDTFGSSVERVWNGLQAVVIWFLGNIIEILLVLILLGAVALVTVLLLRKTGRNKKQP